MRVGFVAGAFDLLHAGHVHLLRQCALNCDFLIIGLHVDPSIERKSKNKPVESVFEREIRLEGCEYVDKVIVYETENDLSLMLRYIRPDVRFLGNEYIENHKDRPITDRDSIPLVYVDSLPIHSSDLRKRVKEATK